MGTGIASVLGVRGCFRRLAGGAIREEIKGGKRREPIASRTDKSRTDVGNGSQVIRRPMEVTRSVWFRFFGSGVIAMR